MDNDVSSIGPPRIGDQRVEYADLIERLEKAPRSSRELDRAITELLWPGEPLQWPDMYKATSEHWAKRPIERYTASIDAALTLVPEGMWWSAQSVPAAEGGFFGSAACAEAESDNAEPCDATTPAIALCIAALKARST